VGGQVGQRRRQVWLRLVVPDARPPSCQLRVCAGKNRSVRAKGYGSIPVGSSSAVLAPEARHRSYGAALRGYQRAGQAAHKVRRERAAMRDSVPRCLKDGPGAKQWLHCREVARPIGWIKRPLGPLDSAKDAAMAGTAYSCATGWAHRSPQAAHSIESGNALNCTKSHPSCTACSSTFRMIFLP